MFAQNQLSLCLILSFNYSFLQLNQPPKSKIVFPAVPTKALVISPPPPFGGAEASIYFHTLWFPRPKVGFSGMGSTEGGFGRWQRHETMGCVSLQKGCSLRLLLSIVYLIFSFSVVGLTSLLSLPPSFLLSSSSPSSFRPSLASPPLLSLFSPFLSPPSLSDHMSSPTSVTPHPSPLLLKVRVSGSGESDFVEVEVAPPTYPALVSACCEELELSPSDVAKIRKLPSVLVRKDRDVQRMADGQELEVVLKGEGSIGGSLMSVISPPAVAASYPTTSVLTVNPFAPPTTAVLALSSQGVHMQRGSPVATAAMVTTEGLVTLKSDENGAGTSNHISGMTSDSGEVQNHTHSHTHQPGIVNGLQ